MSPIILVKILLYIKMKSICLKNHPSPYKKPTQNGVGFLFKNMISVKIKGIIQRGFFSMP